VSIEGVFAIAYGGNIGLGLAVIKVADGQVFGHDFVGSKFTGTAIEDDYGSIDFDVTMEVKPGRVACAGNGAPRVAPQPEAQT
jgi:hypothetical protein